MKAPSPAQHPRPTLVSAPPFPLEYLLFPGQRQVTCSSSSISLLLFLGTRRLHVLSPSQPDLTE